MNDKLPLPPPENDELGVGDGVGSLVWAIERLTIPHLRCEMKKRPNEKAHRPAIGSPRTVTG